METDQTNGLQETLPQKVVDQYCNLVSVDSFEYLIDRSLRGEAKTVTRLIAKKNNKTTRSVDQQT